VALVPPAVWILYGWVAAYVISVSLYVWYHPGSVIRHRLKYSQCFSPRIVGSIEPYDRGSIGGSMLSCIAIPEIRSIMLDGRKAPIEFPAADTEFARDGTPVLSRPDPAWPCVVTLKCGGRVWTAHVDEETANWLEQFYTYGPMPDLPAPRNAWGIRPSDWKWNRGSPETSPHFSKQPESSREQRLLKD